ncbi:ComEA family DNA-binding protein [Actinoplanes sp. NPDC051346]|uniref:ComEA family DNA-binding protein n=1 Tax=Actinoplanes sp. NPDC051346 TaxID=3155048 RepID=UPI00341BBE3B
MREENNPEASVRARLMTVLTVPAVSSADPRWPAPGGPALSWAEVVPGWPDDVVITAPPVAEADPGDATGETDLACRPPWSGDSSSAEPALSGAGAFGGGAPGSRLGLFDPGRRGVRALAAVAVVVVVIAAVLAWRARPRIEPASPPLAAAEPTSSSPPTEEVVVAVGGKVHKPGLVQLAPGSRVADAVRAAGGARPGVDVAPLNLARKVVDGELIMVGVPQPPGAAPAGGGTSAGGLVNLNTATIADLDTLPGVGPVLAQRILDARDAQGGFRAVSDLRKVDGIGTARYEQLQDLVTV